MTPPDWPLRGGVQVPPELLRKVQKRETLIDGSLLSRLARKPLKDLTPSERFTLLAQIHDACYANNHIGPTDLREYQIGEGHYLASVGVLEYEETKGRRLTKTEITRLHDVLASVLVRIEAKVDPTSKDENGELLVDVVIRLRQKWKLRSAQTVAVQSRISSAMNSKRRDLREKTKRPPHRPPDTDEMDDAKIGDAWLRGRSSGEFHTYRNLADELKRNVVQVKEALDRDRHRRPDVWMAKRKPRRKKSVKTK